MLEIKAKINEVKVQTVLGDLRITAGKDHRQLVYTGLVRDRQVPISFIGMEDSSPQNIELEDINEFAGSVTRRENSFLIRHSRRVGTNFLSPTRDALITDQVVETPYGNIPLFYSHRLTDISDLDTIRIRDKLLNEVDSSFWYAFINSDGDTEVCHSLEARFDIESNFYNVFYIEYTTDEEERRLLLLEESPLYRKAILEDGLVTTRRIYTTRKRGAGYEYSILFRRNENGARFTGPWYTKVSRDFQIKMGKPILARPNERWTLSIRDAGIIAEADDGEIYHYEIPEYHFQTFIPIEPKKFSEAKECHVLDANLIVLPFKNIIADTIDVADVLVTDKDLDPKFGFTTSDTGAVYWTDRLDLWSPQHGDISLKLLTAANIGVNFSRSKGLLHLPMDLEMDDRVFIRGAYNEYEYEYGALNLNPLHNSKIIGSRAVIYIVPQEVLDDYPAERPKLAVHHLIINRAGEIISFTDHQVAEDPDLPFDKSNVKEEGIGDHAQGHYNGFVSLRGEVLILGSATVRRRQRVEELSIIDVRQHGGILKHDIEEMLLTKTSEYPELLWLSEDSIAEKTIPMQGAAVIRLPRTLLDEAGGEFRREEIKEIIQRHMALGSYPIIEYYLPAPVITSVEAILGDSPTLPETLPIKLVWKAVSAEINRLFKEKIKQARGVQDSDAYRHAERRLFNTAESYRIYVSTFLSPENLGTSGQLFYQAVDSDSITFTSSGLDITAEFDLPDIIRETVASKLYFFVVPIAEDQEWEKSEVVELSLYNYWGTLHKTEVQTLVIETKAITGSAPGSSTSVDIEARFE